MDMPLLSKQQPHPVKDYGTRGDDELPHKQASASTDGSTPRVSDASAVGDWLSRIFPVELGGGALDAKDSNSSISSPGYPLLAAPSTRIEDETDVDEMIALEMNGLSLKEREAVYEELHGVAPSLEEPADFVEQKLEDLEVELVLIPNKAAYELAQQQDPKYTEDRDLRLMFLRSVNFDTQHAAERLVGWFGIKKDLFGEEKLCKTITLDDLSEAALSCLRSGRFQVLPTRDRAGRVVLCDMMSFHKDLFVSVDSTIEAVFYFMMALVEDPETQKTGIVCVHHAHDWQMEMDTEMRAMFWGASKLTRYIPIRFNAFHFCANPNMVWFSTFVNLLKLAVQKEIRHRFRTHLGSATESQYTLLGFGIPVSLLPVTEDGRLMVSQHQSWLDQRYRKEHLATRSSFPDFWDTSPAALVSDVSTVADEESTTNASLSVVEDYIIIPKRFDVLLGRGRPFQEHSGNCYLKDLINETFAEYEATPKNEKTVMAENLVKRMHAKGGRFLKKNATGDWVEVSFKEARDKVSHGYRKKREMDAKANVAIVVSTGNGTNKRVRL